MSFKKVLTQEETNDIVNKLKSGLTINHLRNVTGYGTFRLKEILKNAGLALSNDRSHKGRITKAFENIFIESSKTGNATVVKSIKQHNLIPHATCYHCGLAEWLNGKLTLELDHINGNNRDHRLDNLRFLCPNCHSQTSTYKGKGINNGKVKVSDAALIRALKETPNIRQALIQVGLSPKGGNYNRAHQLNSIYNRVL